ncbi:hypothetical protein [Fluviicola sp.]|jgi:hypothetical protein|uniref:hypothetical protein n=1 Tax=Fluviicola sp. TaxID=1917219 RepID=UPI0028227984|nr:hypothetical protein [Fluviicola sp.]MDR0801172.1 hypothetical protein [Fluviicola sp.]
MKVTEIKTSRQAGLISGLLALLIAIALTACKENGESNNKGAISGIPYISAIDSVSFNYQSPSWKGGGHDYSDDQFGRYISVDSNNHFRYISINSYNELHTYDFSTHVHTYSRPVCKAKIEAFKIDSSLIYLLYNDTLFVKDFQLNTVDSFTYKRPNILQKHGIDYDSENSSNLFKVNNYYVLMYFVVYKIGDHEEYRNSKYLFHYFNKDTSFFANKVCNELDTSSIYFRYPAVTSDGQFLYHAPRMKNCISKSNELKTLLHVSIDKTKNNYLPFHHGDQFQISVLKKLRFSSDYNKDILISGNHVILLREFLKESYYKNNIQNYNLDTEIIIFNKDLKKIRSYFIKDNGDFYSLVKNNKLYLFNVFRNKYYVYEI